MGQPLGQFLPAGGREQVSSSVTSQLMGASPQQSGSPSSSINATGVTPIPPLPAAWGRHRDLSPQTGKGRLHTTGLQGGQPASPCSSQGSTTQTSACQAFGEEKEMCSRLDINASSRQEAGAEVFKAGMPDKSTKRRAGPCKSENAAEKRDLSAGRPPRYIFALSSPELACPS